jgi:hypothetical protein
MGDKYRVFQPGHFVQRWERPENQYLLKLWQEGKSDIDIGDFLGRYPGAVKAQREYISECLIELGLARIDVLRFTGLSEKTMIYVIECKNGKYYVGKTNQDADYNIIEYFSFYTQWLKEWGPRYVTHSFEVIETVNVDFYVRHYMRKYGSTNVRGGSYNSPKLRIEQLKELRETLWEGFGEPSSFATGLNLLRITTCEKCGLIGHSATVCSL